METAKERSSLAYVQCVTAEKEREWRRAERGGGSEASKGTNSNISVVVMDD